MDQAKVAVGGTTSAELFRGMPKPANLPSSQIGIAALSALIMLPVVLLVVGDLMEPTAVPLPLRHAAPPPTGTWSCGFSDETVGMLTVDGWGYTLAINGGQMREGTLAPVGGQALKNKAAYVQVESGPLKDDFSLGLGLHDDVAEPDSLFFNMGPGSGVSCVRT